MFHAIILIIRLRPRKPIFFLIRHFDAGGVQNAMTQKLNIDFLKNRYLIFWGDYDFISKITDYH